MSKSVRLRSLPLNNCDFVSACMTAGVSRVHLTLVIVRVVASGAAGGVDVARCRSLAFLFDGRHDTAALAAAVTTAVSEWGGTVVYTRLPGATGSVMLSLTTGSRRDNDDDDAGPAAACSPRSIIEEMTLPNGMLRSAVHTSGALRAWQRQTSCKSAVCVKTAVAVVAAGGSGGGGARSDAEEAIFHGLQKLTGNGRPTPTVPAACECDETPACNCFMRRAMYKAGTTWLILYAAVPPPLRPMPALVVAAALPATPGWLYRLLDGTASESEQPQTTAMAAPFRDTNPSGTWAQGSGMPFAVMQALWSATGDDGAASESSCDATVSCAAAAPASICTGCMQMCVEYALHQQDRDCTVAVLVAASSLIGPFYGPLLTRVIAMAGSSSWPGMMRRAARVADGAVRDDADAVYALLRPHGSAGSAMVHAIAHIAAPRTAGPRTAATMSECEYIGFVAAVVALTLHFVDCHARNAHPHQAPSPPPPPALVPAARLVNCWPVYTFLRQQQ